MLIYVPVIRGEQTYLRSTFPGYAEYTQQVPSLVPRTLWFAGVTNGFSRELYFRHREYNSLLGAAAIYGGPDCENPLVPRVKVTTSIARTSIVLALACFVPHSPRHSAPPACSSRRLRTPPRRRKVEDKIGSGSHIQPLRPGFQFPYGQTLHYEGEWRFFTAGVATVRIERAGSQNHVTATADSTGVVAMLYRVQDRFDSYFDAKTLCSSKLIKHTEEGSHRRDTVITYDYARGKSVLDERNLKTNQQKKVENDIPNCVTDVVSGILYVAQPAAAGRSDLHLPAERRRQHGHGAGHVEGKEQVKTPAGTFQTVRVGSEGNYGSAEEPRPHLDLVHRRRPAPSGADEGKAVLGNADHLPDQHHQVAALLHAKAFGDHPLQARLVENVVGKLLVGKHGQGGALGIGRQLRSLFHRKLGVLADDRQHHVHHDLQPAQLAALVFLFLLWVVRRLAMPLGSLRSDSPMRFPFGEDSHRREAMGVSISATI